MKSITVTGRTVEDAIKSGLQQLMATEDRVKITILEQSAKGLFGLIGSKDARVEIELVPDPIDEAIAFLRDVMDGMGLNVEIQTEDMGVDGQGILISGPDMGMIIGRRGQTLDALQYLVNIVANRHSKDHVRIVLDAEQFRKRRRRTLEELAQRLATRVIKGHKEIILEPMTPQERKIIHSYLQNHPKVKTFSKGEEPNRKVVISLK
ncbi:MAG: RNA-binding cell elongation regulator Jag/EloR [Paenibacillaceae bacterium]